MCHKNVTLYISTKIDSQNEKLTNSGSKPPVCIHLSPIYEMFRTSTKYLIIYYLKMQNFAQVKKTTLF